MSVALREAAGNDFIYVLVHHRNSAIAKAQPTCDPCAEFSPSRYISSIYDEEPQYAAESEAKINNVVVSNCECYKARACIGATDSR